MPVDNASMGMNLDITGGGDTDSGGSAKDTSPQSLEDWAAQPDEVEEEIEPKQVKRRQPNGRFGKDDEVTQAAGRFHE